MKADHGYAENIQMISASSMSLLKMRVNSGSQVIKSLKSIVGNVLRTGIKDSNSMIKILKNRKGFAYFMAPFFFVAATALVAQDVSLEDRLELLKNTLLELDISATKCLEQLEDTRTKSGTDCDEFLNSLDGKTMADYITHCEVLKSWRDSFIADPSASNNDKETVYLKEILESNKFESKEEGIALSLGKNIGGEPTITVLSLMPHLMIAGTTGSGKSVGINGMILSILYLSLIHI